MNIEQAIAAFRDEKYENPDFVHGDCDPISIKFLETIEGGILLAVDNPHVEPSLGWEYYGGHWRDGQATISHFLAYFPDEEIAVDWTARQFWHDCPVPMILTKTQLLELWNELPFGWEDAREFDEAIAQAHPELYK